VIWGVACYLMWGFFPAFFPLLEPADPMEILAHRFGCVPFLHSGDATLSVRG
jgi:EamA domain-containing membrane protein RarD